MKEKIRIKIEKISTGKFKYVNRELNIDSLHDIQTRVGKKENGYRIISYTLI